MSVTKTLILRAYAIRARIFTIALDLQVVLVRKSTVSRSSRLNIYSERAVAGLW